MIKSLRQFWRRLAWGAGILICAWAPLAGQVQARPASVSDIPKTELTSPMVVELPLEDMQTEEPVVFEDQGKYVCDDTSLPRITVQKKIRDRGAVVELDISAEVHVRSSYDRFVDLQFTIVKSGVSAASWDVPHLSVPERYSRMAKARMQFKADAYAKLFNGKEKVILKAVMSVQSNQ